MAYRVGTAAVRSSGRSKSTRPSKRASGIRWDRLARWAMVLVLVGIACLYVGPTRSYIATWQQAKDRRAEVAKLSAENRRLRARRRQLASSQALEREARKLGMVRPGERPYALDGIGR